MQTKFLVRSFLVLVILALGTVACGGTETTAEEDTATTEDAATDTSGSESSDDTTDTTTTPTDSNTATETPVDDTDDSGDDDSGDDTASGDDDSGDDDTGDDDVGGDDDADDSDTTPPTVTKAATDAGVELSSDPSTKVLQGASFIVTFSEALTESEDIATKFTVVCNTVLQVVTLSAAEDTDGIVDNEVKVNPNDPLPIGGTCILSVLTGITDLAGNASTADATFALHTAAEDDGSGNDDPADDDGDTGGDDETPTVAAKANTASTESTLSSGTNTLVAANTTFILTFTVPVTTPETIADQITLSCETSGAQTFIPSAAADDDADTIINNEFVITPDADLPSGEACMLTIAATPVGDGTTSTAEAAFPLNTCGLSDDFSDTNSLSLCWTAGADNDDLLTSSVADDVATLSVAADVSTTTETEQGTEIKDVGYTKTVNGTDFTLITTFTGISGLEEGFGASGTDAVLLTANTGGETQSSIICGPGGSGDDRIDVIFWNTSADPSTMAFGGAFGADSSIDALTVRLTRSGTAFICSYSTNGVNFTTIGEEGITAPEFDGQESTVTGLTIVHGAGSEALTAVIGEVSLTEE